MINKKVFIKNPFFCSEFKNVSRIVIIVHSELFHPPCIYVNIYFSSIYQDQGIFDENWEENCEVAQEFSEKNYRPSPDGDYVLKFVDPTNVVDMDQLAKLRVDISGTLIPIQSKKKILI